MAGGVLKVSVQKTGVEGACALEFEIKISMIKCDPSDDKKAERVRCFVVAV